MFTVYCFRTDIKHHYYNIFDTVNAEDLEQMVLNPLQDRLKFRCAFKNSSCSVVLRFIV